MRLPRRRRADDTDLAGSLDSEYPQPSPDPYASVSAPAARTPPPVERHDPEDEIEFVERPPSALRRFAAAAGETRRRVLPLPDEVIDQYLGNGERMIHNDHPSFRSFVVQNTLLFAGFLILAVIFLGITFSGSLLAAAFILLVLCMVLLVLVLKRLGDRYTSYVVTDTRIMRISGVISRRAHSIPWVRVTDLTIEQSLMGRLFGYATLHIESANEDSGLRDLLGVSDPLQFNQYVVDMVVAKQGSTEPKWVQTGEPAPVAMGRGLRRLRARRRAADDVGGGRSERADTGTGADDGGRTGAAPRAGSGARPATQRGDDTQVAPRPPLDEDTDFDDLDPETLAENLRAAGQTDLPWRK